jgi:hypothetical protein
MNTSILSTKNRVSLPGEIVKAARLRLNDEIFWTVDKAGELHGRKLAGAHLPAGRIAIDRQTGLHFWQGEISDDQAAEAALTANLSRHD